MNKIEPVIVHADPLAPAITVGDLKKWLVEFEGSHKPCDECQILLATGDHRVPLIPVRAIADTSDPIILEL